MDRYCAVPEIAALALGGKLLFLRATLGGEKIVAIRVVEVAQKMSLYRSVVSPLSLFVLKLFFPNLHKTV